MRRRNRLWGLVILLLVASIFFWAAAARQARVPGPAQSVSGNQNQSAPIDEPPPTAAPATLPEAPPPTDVGRVRHYYHTLAPEERQAYRDIYSQLPGFPASVEIAGLSAEAMGRVFQALMFDQPLLFQVSSTHYKTATLRGEVVGFLPEYRLTRAEYEAQREELLAVCRGYIAQAQGNGYQAELALHDQLARDCVYTDDTTDSVHNTAYGALVGKKAACEGYSKAMLMLLEMRDIDAYIVTGNAVNSVGVSGGHAWNKVKIDGGWYHLDATWDAPVVEKDESRYVSHAFFNLSDEEIAASHELTDPSNPCVSTAANYFTREGLTFSSLGRDDEAALARQLVKSMNAGNGCLELRFTGEEAMRQGWSYLFETPEQRVYRILSVADMELPVSVRTDTVYRSEMKELQIIRVFPAKK